MDPFVSVGSQSGLLIGRMGGQRAVSLYIQVHKKGIIESVF